MKHLVFVGACYIDTILSVPHYPDEDAKQRATTVQVRRGGNCGNTLEVLQQLLGSPAHPSLEQDVKLHLVSTLPARASRAAETITSALAAEPGQPSVSLAHCLYRKEHREAASSYIVRSEATGSRTIVNHNPLPEMTAGEFESIVDDFRNNHTASETWWHFEGRIPETLLHCIEYLRHELPSSKVSVEVEKPGREGLREIAALADVVFYSKSWAEGTAAVAAASKAKSRDVEHDAITAKP